MQYTKKFREFENSPNLHEFRGEDKRLQQQVVDLQKKYIEILSIFNNIQNEPAHNRIKYIDNIKSYMKGIEKKVKEQEIYIKNRQVAFKEALKNVVPLEGNDLQVEKKLLAFIMKETIGSRNFEEIKSLSEPTNLFKDMIYHP